MNVFSIIFFVIIIAGLSFLLVWNVYKIVQTLIKRRKSKNDNKDDTKQEKGNKE